jgi:hypothetical protein
MWKPVECPLPNDATLAASQTTRRRTEVSEEIPDFSKYTAPPPLLPPTVGIASAERCLALATRSLTADPRPLASGRFQLPLGCSRRKERPTGRGRPLVVAADFLLLVHRERESDFLARSRGNSPDSFDLRGHNLVTRQAVEDHFSQCTQCGKEGMILAWFGALSCSPFFRRRMSGRFARPWIRRSFLAGTRRVAWSAVPVPVRRW